MSKLYNVKKFNSDGNYHVLEDLNGNKYFMDIMVDGGWPEDTNPEDLVGKKIRMERSYAFISIAVGVEEVG